MKAVGLHALCYVHSYIPIGFGIHWHVGFAVRCFATFARASKLSYVILRSLPNMVMHLTKCR